MIRKYRIKSSLENYRASFEMLLDDNQQRRNQSLTHIRNLISHYEDKYVDARTFKESYREIEVVGNTYRDLNTAQFRQYIMGEATCIRFVREELVVDIIPFIEKPTELKDDEEFSEYIDQWREEGVTEYLKLAGLSMTPSKNKRRKRTAV